MILSDKQTALVTRILEKYYREIALTEEEQGLWDDLSPSCPPGLKTPEFLAMIMRTGRTDLGAFAPQTFPSTKIPISAATQEQFNQIAAQKAASAGSGDASGMLRVQERIRGILKARPDMGIYAIMLKCYDDPVCKRWYKTSPWLLRLQITNAIRAIIDAEEADVLAFISGAPVAPSDF